MIISNEKQLDFIFDVLIEDAYKVIKTSNSKDAITAAVDFLSNILTSYLPKEDEETNLESRIKFNLFLTKSDDSFRLQDSNKILRGGKKDDASREKGSGILPSVLSPLVEASLCLGECVPEEVCVCLCGRGHA